MTWSAPPPTGASCRAGSDDTGELRLDRAYLGHQHLSIVDVSGGRQPIALVRSASPNLLLARESAKKIKVVLTGGSSLF